MGRLIRLLLGTVALLTAQQDPRDLLSTTRAIVMDTVHRLPKYMCTQTIDRVRYTTEFKRHLAACDEPAKGLAQIPEISDRLRMDVAVSPTREMFSWAGTDKFDDREVLDIVRDGSISTGEFAGSSPPSSAPGRCPLPTTAT